MPGVVFAQTVKRPPAVKPDCGRSLFSAQQHRLKHPLPNGAFYGNILFRDNLPLVQLVLRILTGKPDLVITSCQTQKDIRRLAGARSLCLDAYGTDASGKKYNLEIQRADKGADPHRARYHASVMDIEHLDASQPFDQLPDTYTIFITEKDFYGQGKAFYPIERINLATGKPFEDGEHILYVNGEYRDDTDIGKLMHDFNCTSAARMHFSLLAEKTHYLKENQRGVSEMCKVIEDWIQEERAEERAEAVAETIAKAAAEEHARNVEKACHMLTDGALSLEKIAKYSGLPLQEVEKLQATRTVGV